MKEFNAILNSDADNSLDLNLLQMIKKMPRIYETLLFLLQMFFLIIQSSKKYTELLKLFIG
jgi:hypothetical protein